MGSYIYKHGLFRACLLIRKAALWVSLAFVSSCVLPTAHSHGGPRFASRTSRPAASTPFPLPLVRTVCWLAFWILVILIFLVNLPFHLALLFSFHLSLASSWHSVLFSQSSFPPEPAIDHYRVRVRPPHISLTHRIFSPLVHPWRRGDLVRSPHLSSLVWCCDL